MEPIPIKILASAPLKDKSVPKETRASHLRCFQILVSAFRFMFLAQNYLNSIVDDSYECLNTLRTLGERKADMASLAKNTKKFNGNLELLLDIYSFLMTPDNLKQVWTLHETISEVLGIQKVGHCFDEGLFHLFHKLILSANLAIQ